MYGRTQRGSIHMASIWSLAGSAKTAGVSQCVLHLQISIDCEVMPRSFRRPHAEVSDAEEA